MATSKLADRIAADHVEAVAQRVLDGKGTEEDVKTIAAWSRAMSCWLRTRAPASLEETIERAATLRERAERELGAAVSP